MIHFIKFFKKIIKYLNCCTDDDEMILAIYDPTELDILSENEEDYCSKYISSQHNYDIQKNLLINA